MALMRRSGPYWTDFQELAEKLFEGGPDRSWLRVEEFVEDKTLVVRAELPGIDPDKDVDLEVTDGQLRIKAHREEKSEQKEKDSYRSEFRYGSFSRTIPLPAGATEANVTATYADGVLEVRVPIADEVPPASTKVPITRS